MKNKLEKSYGEITSLIAKNTTIKGNVEFIEEIVIEGKVLGDIIAIKDDKCHVRILESGVVNGNIFAQNVFINGTVQGQIHCSDILHCSSNSKITGDITYVKVEISSGAIIHGKVSQDTSSNILKKQKSQNSEVKTTEVPPNKS